MGLSKQSQIDKWDSTILSYASDPQSYVYWNCHTIPPNMTLCKSVGYSRMVLPNFLQHESLREAIQQANVWVALVNTDCHPDIQRFLCSLYAPVCLKSHQEAKIPPCWELCDEVRNACLPRMRLFGFDWPEIVRCKQFPRLAESMCIPPQEKNTAVTCVPCEQAITLENIASSYCMSDVVLKASIKDLIPKPNDASLVLKISPRTIAFKLIRNDGTQLSSIDQYRRKRRSQKRQNHFLARRHRNAKSNPINTKYYEARENSDSYEEFKSRRRNKIDQAQRKRRLKPRNSKLHDLDGINELVLGCSACTALLPFTSGHLASGLINQKWLVMGRRIKDEKSKKFNNQLQVTFLGIWNRESAEFRQSLYAIRKEPVAHLCNRNHTTITTPTKSRANHYRIPRPLKILRSAPAELSDSPFLPKVPNQPSEIKTANRPSETKEYPHSNSPYPKSLLYDKDNDAALVKTSKHHQPFNHSMYRQNTIWSTDHRPSNAFAPYESVKPNGQYNNDPENDLFRHKEQERRNNRRKRRKLRKLQKEQQQVSKRDQNEAMFERNHLPINPYALIL